MLNHRIRCMYLYFLFTGILGTYNLVEGGGGGGLTIGGAYIIKSGSLRYKGKESSASIT